MLLLSEAKGGRPPTLKCIHCDKVDPLKSVEVRGWATSKSLRGPTAYKE
jgi:hypothetical protein